MNMHLNSRFPAPILLPATFCCARACLQAPQTTAVAHRPLLPNRFPRWLSTTSTRQVQPQSPSSKGSYSRQEMTCPNEHWPGGEDAA